MAFDFNIEQMLIKLYHENCVENNSPTPPMLVLFRDEERILAIQARDVIEDDPDGEDKLECFKEMVSIIPTTEANNVIFCADAWVSFKKHERPSLDPNSVDALLIMRAWPDGTVEGNSYPYIRHEQVIYWLSEGIFNSTSHKLYGLMADLFKKAFAITGKSFSVTEHITILRSLGHDVLQLRDPTEFLSGRQQ